MNDKIFDIIAQRFTSSIHVPIKSAEITLEEWQQLKEFRTECVETIEQLEDNFKRQAKAALTGMDAAKKSAYAMEEHAKKLYAASNPEALESERAMNAELTDEIERLEGKVEYLTEIIHSLQENA